MKLPKRMIVNCANATYDIRFENGPFVSCGKRVDVAHRATNIYRLGPDGWKIIHHHTDKSDGAIAVFESIKD